MATDSELRVITEDFEVHDVRPHFGGTATVTVVGIDQPATIEMECIFWRTRAGLEADVSCPVIRLMGRTLALDLTSQERRAFALLIQESPKTDGFSREWLDGVSDAPFAEHRPSPPGGR